MRKKSSKLKFNIVLNFFYNEVKKFISFMRRDQAEFARFGVKIERINSLDEKLEAFSNLPTDDEMEGEQVNATAAKDDLAEQLKDAISKIMVRVEDKFGKGSGHYHRFGAGGISQLDGGSLDTCARRVARVALIYLQELEDKGLTAQMITDLLELDKNYSTALAMQEDSIANRDIATENRVDLANAIYDEMVKICNTGKRMWESVDAARYNDYIIYDTPSGSADKTAPTAQVS